jgi:hypothetical protein
MDPGPPVFEPQTMISGIKTAILAFLGVIGAGSGPAAAEPPTLARDGNRIVLVGAPEYAWDNAPAELAWERLAGKSSVRAVTVNDGLTINARLDLPGPGWLTVEVRCDGCGWLVTTSDGSNTTTDAGDTLADLSLDSRTIVNAIVAHTGANGLPDLAVLDALKHDTGAGKARAMEIVAAMDSDDYRTREKAQRELEREPQAIAWLVRHCGEMRGLSPEAETRVNAAVVAYQ